MFTNRDEFRVKKTIGSSWNVDEDDVVKTKTALKKTGDYKAPDWGVTGYPDQDMFDGLKSFQKREGLQVDGVMKPGGPTEKRLAQKTKPPTAAGTVARTMQPEAGNRQRPDQKPSSKRIDGFSGPTDWSGIKMTTGPSLPPDGASETGNELPNGRKRGPARNQRRPDEAQVAMMPTTVPGLGDVGIVGARRSPAERGEAGGGGGGALLLGAAAAKLLKDRQRQFDESGSGAPKVEDRGKDRSNRVAVDPPPPTPGFEPPDEKLPDRTESPAEPVELPMLEGRPIPGPAKPHIETFPIEDSLGQALILESRGHEMTQGKNAVIIKIIDRVSKEHEIEWEHLAGAETVKGDYMKERLYPATKGEKGMRPDFNTRVKREDGSYGLFDGNTVDTRVDGETLTPREADALRRYPTLISDLEEEGILSAYPKIPDMDLDEYEKFVEPLVRRDLLNFVRNKSRKP